MDLGLQGLDLAGEVGRDLPPAIALRLEELPHAGVLGLKGECELGGPRVGCCGRFAGWAGAAVCAATGGSSLLTGKGIPRRLPERQRS